MQKCPSTRNKLRTLSLTRLRARPIRRNPSAKELQHCAIFSKANGDRHRMDKLRKRGRDFGKLLLDAVDHMQCILAIALQRDATHHLALAIELGDAARRSSGPSSMRATSRSSTGVPPCILRAISSKSLLLRK